MSYTTGILDSRITILNRADATDGEWGRVSGDWEEGETIWAAVDWARGSKSMREGAMDAYDSIMVRTRWRDDLTRESRILYDDVTYQIDSFHADKRANTIQITASELPNAE